MSRLPNIRVQRRPAPGPLLALCGVLWVAAVGSGLGMLARYSAIRGDPAEAPHDWPDGSSLRLDPERHTLVMIVHPHCSCSRASLAELNSLMTRLQGRVAAYVLLSTPEGFDEAWAKGPLWNLASIIPDTKVRMDVGSPEANLFGAKTSGQTYLFNPEGDLLFSGGITPSRGHQGNSHGRERIIALVTQSSAERGVSDVFGCPIHASDLSQQLPDSEPIARVADGQQREQ
jgi:hypothetical protein